MLLFRLIPFAVAALCLPGSDGPPGAGQYNYKQDVTKLFQKRQIAQTWIIGSLPTFNGTVPLRREIREMQQDHEAWTLYLLALSWIQYMDQDDAFSFYGVAGIHGVPFVNWAGVANSSGVEDIGYCTHVSNLFPSWHRTYLALYEQTLYRVVQFIASLYEGDRQGPFLQAAQNFRLPYWDWALVPSANESVLPFCVGGSPNVVVDGPDGNQTIGNPVYSYAFKPLDPDAFTEFPFYLWNQTMRAPRPVMSADAVSNDSYVASTMDVNIASYQQRLYNLFASNGNYTTFSNEAWMPYPANITYDSLESLHDTIHIAAGGAFGHMAIIGYSAMDPVFFLHHAMVDRVFTIWQQIYPDSWVQPMAALEPTRTIAVGSMQDARSDLTPFFINDTHFWNSDAARNHKIFGYTYAETASGVRADAIAAVNNLYTKFSPATLTAKRKRNHQMSKRNQDESKVPIEGGMTWDMEYKATPLMIVQDGAYSEWVANIRANKHAMHSSFQVLLFLGNVPDNSSTWETSETLVGTMGVFANIGAMHHSNRNVSGTIPMTSALVDAVYAGDIPSLDPQYVRPFLAKELQFRVVLNNGTVVNPGDVDSLYIGIASSRVQAPRSNLELTSWGTTETHFELHT